MATEPETGHEAIAAGHDALARGAWDEARERFEAARSGGEAPRAREGLGWVGWWRGDDELTVRAREAAYVAFRAAGDRAGAGRVAAWLASDFLEFREDAVAHGWLERGHRMLDGLPEGEEHAWLALHEGAYVMNLRGDMACAAELARRAAALGRKLGVADLEAIGMALEGVTLVRRGSVEAGMRLLDEASIIARTEELQSPISEGWALC
jgi:hypothetical protein